MTDQTSAPKFRRLPPRAAVWLMPLLLSVMMTFIVSGVATLRGIGLAPDFFTIWMQAWGLSWLVAFPTMLVVLPIVRRIVVKLVEPA